MASHDDLIFGDLSETLGYPERSEELSIVKQGPVRRIAIWREILEDPLVNGSVKAHYYDDKGILVIDLHNGES